MFDFLAAVVFTNSHTATLTACLPALFPINYFCAHTLLFAPAVVWIVILFFLCVCALP